MEHSITGDRVPGVYGVRVRTPAEDTDTKVCQGCGAPQAGGERCRHCGAEVR